VDIEDKRHGAQKCVYGNQMQVTFGYNQGCVDGDADVLEPF
jgi:hypothetical protein